MKQKLFLLIFFFAFYAQMALANNIAISNVALSGQNNALKFKLVNFDITWQNSWYINGGPQNWDAAWVFVKYRYKTQTTWHHATFNHVDGTGSGDGHIEPANSDIRSSNDNGANGAHGVFIHRTDLGQGTVNFAGVKLRWNYGYDGLGDGDSVEICVTGIEMVYVPQGSFYAGSGGTQTGEFYTHPAIIDPYFISSEAAITVAATAGNLYYSVAGGDQLGPIPAAFPKGFNAFYCMKYEITQSQYVAFLNKLTYTQQVTRTEVIPTSAAGTAAMTTGTLFRNGIEIMTSGVVSTTPASYACDFTNDGNYDQFNDGQSIACNYLSWADVAAYLDWAALRPITELEYEKAGRGNQIPVANEYAWGSTSITGATSISNSGANNEIAQAGANCVYGNSGVLGPMRSGNFAQPATSRVQAGASYYGIMELSGNVDERTVTVGNTEGRAFTGSKGDGVLNGLGNANALNWPGPANTALGAGYRGGNWIFFTNLLSIRNGAATLNGDRYSSYGGRGCRLAP
jgi:formylglycine-generating enzyme required for sulfatase activity